MLTKPLPNFAKLGDKLERVHSNLSAKQYVLRRLMWLLAVVIVVSVMFKKSLLLGLFFGIIFAVWLPLKIMQRKINKENNGKRWYI